MRILHRKQRDCHVYGIYKYLNITNHTLYPSIISNDRDFRPMEVASDLVIGGPQKRGGDYNGTSCRYGE